MSAIKLSWEDFCEAADDHEVVKQTNWRWGTSTTMVFKHNGKHYMATIQIHSQEGWQAEDTVNCREAHKVIKQMEVWEPV